jgi:hypothetical protein
MLFNILALLEQRQEVPPYKVGSNWHKAKNIFSFATLIYKIKTA